MFSVLLRIVSQLHSRIRYARRRRNQRGDKQVCCPLVKLFGHHRYHPLPLIASTVTKARLHIVLKESLRCQWDCSPGILQPPHGLFPVISVYPGDLTKNTALQTDSFRHLAGYALELYSCGENLAPKNDRRQLKVSSIFS